MAKHLNECIVPAVIPESLEHLKEALQAVSFLHEVQIDVVDGQFVPFTSWPYEPAGTPKEAAAYLEPFTVEVDLMVSDPLSAALAWQAVGAQMFVFHIESMPAEVLHEVENRITGTIGISISNSTPFTSLEPYYDIADYFQLMGIREIGSQGQPFDEEVLTRIANIKERFPEKIVSIDGSVNTETIARLKQAGADRFVSGSGILKAETPEMGFKALQDALHR